MISTARGKTLLLRVLTIGILIAHIALNFSDEFKQNQAECIPLWRQIIASLWHTLIEFIKHSWIEIIVAVVVYNLLESRIKNGLYAIPDKVEERDHKKIIKQFKDVNKHIKILDTSIAGFTKHKHILKSNIESAIKKNVEIKILLLHPDTYAAKQRRNDLSADTRTYLEDMKRGLNDLFDCIKDFNSDKITIKLFKATPTMIYTSWDETANFGLLPANMIADHENTFNISSETDLGIYLNSYFENIWKQQAILVDLEEYLFVKVVDGKGKVIERIRWGGSVEDKEIPKYLVTEKNVNNLDNLVNTEEYNIHVIHDHESIPARLQYKFVEPPDDTKTDNYSLAKEQIGKTYGTQAIVADNPIFEIKYFYESANIRLENIDIIKDRINRKGYAFVSHKDYDINFSQRSWLVLKSQIECFERLLEIDQNEKKCINEIRLKYKTYKNNPRERLFLKYKCSLDNGKVEPELIEEDTYKVPYIVNYKDCPQFKLEERVLPTPYKKKQAIELEISKKEFLLSEYESQVEKNPNVIKNIKETKEQIRRAKIDIRFLHILEKYSVPSAIKADLLNLLGIKEFTKLTSKPREFIVYAHLIRTKVTPEMDEALPTPQESSNNYYQYKVIHLVQRRNIQGGLNYITDVPSSCLTPQKKKKLNSAYLLLEKPLDAVFFKNNFIKPTGETININRRASEIKILPGCDEGIRDVLVLEFVML